MFNLLDWPAAVFPTGLFVYPKLDGEGHDPRTPENEHEKHLYENCTFPLVLSLSHPLHYPYPYQASSLYPCRIARLLDSILRTLVTVVPMLTCGCGTELIGRSFSRNKRWGSYRITARRSQIRR